jgi:lipopolysaccharide/colanic/teichoic acid biosynthesis glycosyltransferase
MNQRRLSVAVLIADLVWSAAAMGAALALRYGVHWRSLDKDSALHLLPFLGAAWLIWALFSLLLPLDGFRGGWRLSASVSQLLLAVSGLMLILLSGGYLFRGYASRLALVQFGLLLFLGFVLLRIAFYLLLRARLKNGGVRRVVILGRGRLARELARKVERHPEMLCQVVGFLTPDDGTPDPNSLVARSELADRSTSTLGVVELLSAQRADELILVLDECASPDLLNLSALCRDRGIRVSLVPQFYELYLSRFHLTDLDGLPILQLARSGLTVPALVGKRMLDVALGSLLLLASVPILLPLAVVLRRIKGKAFRWETRCGFQGKPFAMLRLNIDRPLHNGSRFEAILGEFSLTELPQLWNVLRGDMSLVGPRPESRDRVCRYSEWQQQRLTVKPGVTGLAQVQGLREQHSSEEKTRFDLQYLLNCSLWTDLSLLLQTVWTLATRSVAPRDSLADIGLAGAVDEVAGPHVQRDILENAHRP